MQGHYQSFLSYFVDFLAKNLRILLTINYLFYINRGSMLIPNKSIPKINFLILDNSSSITWYLLT